MNTPKEDPRGEWEYQCTSCGYEIDQDHDYCRDCDQRGGEWVLMNDGEPVDTDLYGVEALPELVRALSAYLIRLEEVLDEPEMQIKVDKHGNEACRWVRGGTRVSMQHLRDVLRRAKRAENELV